MLAMKNWHKLEKSIKHWNFQNQFFIFSLHRTDAYNSWQYKINHLSQQSKLSKSLPFKTISLSTRIKLNLKKSPKISVKLWRYGMVSFS